MMQPIIGIIMRANKSESGKNIQVVYDDIIKAVKASGGEAIGIPYDNIKDYIKKEEEDTDEGSIDLSIDCYSNYITISLISLLILLL